MTRLSRVWVLGIMALWAGVAHAEKVESICTLPNWGNTYGFERLRGLKVHAIWETSSKGPAKFSSSTLQLQFKGATSWVGAKPFEDAISNEDFSDCKVAANEGGLWYTLTCTQTQNDIRGSNIQLSREHVFILSPQVDTEAKTPKIKSLKVIHHYQMALGGDPMINNTHTFPCNQA